MPEEGFGEGALEGCKLRKKKREPVRRKKEIGRRKGEKRTWSHATFLVLRKSRIPRLRWAQPRK